MRFNILILAPKDTHYKQKYCPIVFIENEREMVKLPGEYHYTNLHIKPYFKLTTLSPLSHKYLVSYDRYFQFRLEEYVIEDFE
jgi:hypothetical protein